MNIRFTEKAVEFDDVDEFIASLLRLLPEAAATDDESVRARIFPGLIPGDADANGEWCEFVEPGLRELFSSHVDVVAGDLDAIRQDDRAAALRVPVAHVPAWIHTLNQARLALAARHDFGEDEIEGRKPLADPIKGFVLLQMEIYGVILSAFLEGDEDDG